MRRVVVTGLGAVTPVGNTAGEFWEGISAGVCGVAPISRFDTDGFKVKVAAEVKGFDPSPYLERLEQKRNDLYAQYAIASAAQAMADAGLTEYDPERLGVYFGSGIGGIGTMLKEHEKMLKSGPSRISPFLITMMISNLAAGSIAIRYNAKGPCLPVVTACATGSNAIGEAYRAILHGYADAMIAGGAEAPVNALAVAGFTSCMALTAREDPQSASIPFDRRRDGFVMGEGAGCVVLEEYEHAVRRGANIYAELAGYGHTCDAHHITAPDPEAAGAARAIRMALEEAGYREGETVYVNAHGTSTQLNDRAETLALKKVFGEAEAKKLLISSTKSMTGHMLGAAGAVEAVAAVLALKNGLLPPTIGLEEADPDCDLDYLPGTARRAEAGLAISNSLGFGGHNACLAFRRI